MGVKIKYKIDVKVFEKKTNSFHDLSKVFETEILGNHLQDSYHEISSKYILDYFDDEIKDKFKCEDIEVDEFELTSLTKNIEVYFQSNSDSIEYSLSPVIMAYIHKSAIPVATPLLKADSITESSIRWHWNADKGLSSVLTDEKGDIISQLAIGVSEYIETGLKPNTTYKRKVSSYNINGESEFSKVLSIRTKKEEIISNDLHHYSESVEFEHIEKDIETITERLDAFKTGVGHGNDLIVKKQLPIMDSKSRGHIISELKGLGKEVVDIYTKTSFKFRYHLTAKYDVDNVNGDLTLRANGGAEVDCTVRAYSYIVLPLDVHYRLSAKVAYFKWNGSAYEPKTKTIEYRGVYSIPGGNSRATYTKNGFPEMKNLEGVVESRTLETIITTEARKDSEINAALNDSAVRGLVKIYDYRISDSYSYDAAENYIDDPVQYYSDGQFSIRGNTYGRLEGGHLLYASGIPTAQLYGREKVKKVTVAGETTVFTSQEMNYSLYCIANPNLFHNAPLSSCETALEVMSSVSGVALSIKNGAVVAKGTEGVVNGPIVKKVFNNESPAQIFTFDELIPGYDKSKNCVVNVSVEDVNGPVFTSSGAEVVDGDNYSFKVLGDGAVVFECKRQRLPVEHKDVFPPMDQEPLFGVVNYDADIDKGQDGKRTVFYKSYDFALDHSFYDRKVTVSVSDVNPSNSSINYSFMTTNSNYTNMVGDVVTFFSNSVSKKEIEVEHTIAKKLTPVFFNSFETVNVNNKFNVSQNIVSKYNKFKCYFSADNNSIIPQTESVETPASTSVSVSVPVEGVIHPNSSWKLGVHNGYYYMNQKEYFLYADNKPKTSGRQSETITTTMEEVDYIYTENKTIKYGFTVFDVKILTKDGKEYVKRFSYKIKFDTKKYTVVEDFSEIVNEMCTGLGLQMYQIKDIKVVQSDSETTQFTNSNIIDSEATPDLSHIFNNWDKFVTTGENADNLWKWDNNQRKIRCTENWNYTSGFLSDKSFEVFDLEARFTVPQEDWGDDDLMGVILAHTVENGKHHFLVAARALNPPPHYDNGTDRFWSAQWHISYCPDSIGGSNPPIKGRIIKNGTASLKKLSTSSVPLIWENSRIGSTIKVERLGDVFKVKCSEFDSSDIQDYTEIELDLNDFRDLWRFKGEKPYGFCCNSQQFSTFDNIKFSTPVSISGKIEACSKKVEYDFNFGVSEEYKDVIFTEEKETDLVIMNGNKVELSPLPQQFCPIIIEDLDNDVSLEQMFTKDGNSSYTIINQEVILDIETNKIFTTYSNLREGTVVVIVDGRHKVIESIKNNCITLKDSLKAGTKVNLAYRCNDVFKADYNIKKDSVELEHYNDTFKKAMICYEASKDTAFKDVDYISVNPMHNSRYSGFIYIDYNDSEKEVKGLTLNITTDMLYKESSDFTTFNVELVDEYENPIEGKYVHMSITGAELVVKNTVSDENGVIYGDIKNISSQDKITLIASCDGVTDTRVITLKERVGV